MCRVFEFVYQLLYGGKGGKNMDQKKIGSFLKELRKEKGLTQEQLAELADLSTTHISNIENREINDGSIDKINHIS